MFDHRDEQSNGCDHFCVDSIGSQASSNSKEPIKRRWGLLSKGDDISGNSIWIYVFDWSNPSSEGDAEKPRRKTFIFGAKHFFDRSLKRSSRFRVLIDEGHRDKDSSCPRCKSQRFWAWKTRRRSRSSRRNRHGGIACAKHALTGWPTDQSGGVTMDATCIGGEEGGSCPPPSKEWMGRESIWKTAVLASETPPKRSWADRFSRLSKAAGRFVPGGGDGRAGNEGLHG